MKKVLAMVMLLAIMVSLVAATAVRADAEQTDFQVGFSRVDINPYVVDGDITSGILELPLRGSGDVWNRLSTAGLIDDNGDGKIDEEDGLAVTCIAVSDASGNTVLLITIDLIGGGMIATVREEICARVEAALASGELTNVKLTPDQIYYAGTHTHTAPDTTVYASGGKTGTNDAGKELSIINRDLGIWIDRTIEDIGDAAILALKDRAAAKVTKDSLSASRDTQSPVRGKVMNSVRHYNNYSDKAQTKLTCVGGDNFNSRGNYPKQVTDVNDTMYLVQFDFADHNAKTGENKLPIVLANWRGHPSLNNSDSYPGGSRNCISSDYPNAFRHALEYNCTVANDASGVYGKEQVCRAAFFQASGGNVNPRGYENVDSDYGTKAYSWIDELGKKNNECRGNVYGRVLSAMAKHALASTSNRVAVTPGEIRTAQYVYNSVRRDTGISALSYEAAKAYQAQTNPKNPFIYTSASGEIFVVGSKFHANNLTSYWNATLQQPKDDIVDMELNVFMIGKELAFVTAPGEPFDYYYNPDGSNAWNNLINDTYGTPFVLGYCNGAKGYIPNSKAYDYNLGSTKYVRGSYETNITPYAQGTGEHMIDLFSDMLDGLSKGTSLDREGYCQHCKSQVIWKAYSGQSKLYSGHYYLRNDEMTKQIHIAPGETVCFDLNGHTVKSENRVFYTSSKGKATLSIMDSSEKQTGVLMGRGGDYGVINGYGGATVIIDSTNTLNFYSGTMTAYRSGISAVYNAGVLLNKGTVNMYGGVITGGVGYQYTGTYIKSKVPTEFSRDGYAACVTNSGTFNMSGGRIDEGEFKLITGTVTGDATTGYKYSETLSPGTGKGISLYTTGTMNISGDATIADIYFASNSAKLLKFTGPFTGSVGLTLGTVLDPSGVVGTYEEGTDLTTANVKLTNSGMSLKMDGSRITAVTGAVVLDQSGAFTYYDTLSAALKAYTYSETSGNYIRLEKDVTEAVTVSKNAYLDLNGYTISGNVKVSTGKTLYCMDSKTDDYTVADGIYGKISGTCTGNILAMPANSVGAAQQGYRDGYLAVKDADGLSFHRLKLRVSKLSLRPEEVGIYYTGEFGGDEVVAQQVLEYGVALNAFNEPDGDDGSWTYAQTENWTNTGTLTSVMLKGIMKEENDNAHNSDNAQRPIYGRVFVQTKQGYFFSDSVSYSLQQLAETADEAAVIKGEGLEKMAAMYELYAPVMDSWKLPRLRLDMAAMD